VGLAAAVMSEPTGQSTPESPGFRISSRLDVEAGVVRFYFARPTGDLTEEAGAIELGLITHRAAEAAGEPAVAAFLSAIADGLVRLISDDLGVAVTVAKSLAGPSIVQPEDKN
jgi:hypothetical protein